MSVVCEIYGCGIDAVAPCQRCGRPFCQGHASTAVHDDDTLRFFGVRGVLCCDCVSGTIQDQARAREAEQEAKRAAMIEVAHLARQLAAQHPAGDKMMTRSQTKKTIFGGTKRVEVPWKPGWYVGVFPWRSSRTIRGEDVETVVDAPTYVGDAGEPVAPGQPGRCLVSHAELASAIRARLQ